MRPTQHKSNNHVLKAPPGATHDECVPLPVTLFNDLLGNPGGMVSYWRPSDAERRAIAAGALVQLVVMGTHHPPIILAAEGSEGAVTVVQPEDWNKDDG